MSKENHRITSPVQISLSAFCFISVALLLMPTFLVAQESFVIDSVDAHLEPVADTSAPYELFEQLTNLPHVTTRRSVIDRSVAATVGYHDTVSSQAVDEFEAYLRGLRVFSTVEVEANPSATHPGHADVSVQATDSWSLIVLFEDEPGDSEPLVVLEEQNLLGEAKRIGIGTDLPMIDTGSARWMVRYGDPHLFGSDLQLDVRAVLSAHIRDLGFSVERPLFTHKVPVNFGADVRFRTGRETLRYQGDGTATPFFDSIETDKFVATSWVGLPNDEEDLFVGSIAARIDRTLSEAADRPPQAYENTLGLFAGIASVRRRFARRDGYEFSGERFVPTGGTGRVTVGTFLPVADGQDDLLYIGAEARESFLWDEVFFLHASIEAGTGIRDKEAEMTLVRGRASWGTPLGPGHLAGIGLAQVVWRWPRYLFNPATRGVSGLRGYSDLDLFGDNRIVLNNEYRLFPLVDVALWQAGITLFHDMAGVWNQATELSTVRFHHGAGAGIQIGHTEGIGTGFFRFDVAWNFDRGEIGTLSFGVEETFDLFGRLEYSPPGPYLPE